MPVPEVAGSEGRRPRHAGRDLFEQLQPFSGHAVFVNREPGRVPPAVPRLATKPARPGHEVTNTIGTCGSPVATPHGRGPVAATRTSGASAANSAACLRTCRPWPSGCRSAGCRRRSSPIALGLCERREAGCLPPRSAAQYMSTPMRRIARAACARAAERPTTPRRSSVMNSRRLTQLPRRHGRAM